MIFERFPFAAAICILVFLGFCLIAILSMMTGKVYGKKQVRGLFQYILYTCFAYSCVIFIFAGIYCLLGILDPANDLLYMGRRVIVEGKDFNLVFGDLLYFSAMTLFTVGYGDIQPLGALKLIAVIEAFLGYLLPVLVVANGVVKLSAGRKN